MTTTYEDIKLQVIAATVEKLGEYDQQNIPLNTPLKNMGADSLDILELILSFEQEFNIKLPNEDELPADLTIQIITNMIADRLNVAVPQKYIISKQITHVAPVQPMKKPVNTSVLNGIKNIKQNKR